MGGLLGMSLRRDAGWPLPVSSTQGWVYLHSSPAPGSECALPLIAVSNPGGIDTIFRRHPEVGAVHAQQGAVLGVAIGEDQVAAPEVQVGIPVLADLPVAPGDAIALRVADGPQP